MFVPVLKTLKVKEKLKKKKEGICQANGLEEDKKNCRTTQLSHMFFPPPSIFFGCSVCKNSFHFPNAYRTSLQD